MKNMMAGIWRFYADGFRSMTTGRLLWLIIAIKLFVMFFILRLFFFPDFLKNVSEDNDRDGYVSRELILRAAGNEHS